MARISETWLIGGSGDVGLKTARSLAADRQRRIVIAARHGERASTAAVGLGGNARGEAFDASAPGAANRIPSGATVVNLTEATPPALAASVVAHGGQYLETSASPDYVAALASGIGARAQPGLAVFSVGLAPGLTNLMAARIKAEAPETDAIDVIVEMGMGRHHGLAATEWFFGATAKAYPLVLNRTETMRRPGQLSRRVRFADDRADRLALGFGVSDQRAIARTLDLSTARTFIALDPTWATRGMSVALRLGLGGLLSRNAARITRVMSRGPTIGKIGTRLVVEGHSRTRAPTRRIEMKSGDQSELTALIAAEAVRAAGASRLTGVAEITDILDFERAKVAVSAAMPASIFYSTSRPSADGFGTAA
jgi:hypothetical protein